MFWIYGLALLLFQSVHIAFIIGLSHLFFLPIIYQNVQALRDMWVYYALVVLLCSLAAYYKRVMSLPLFAGGIALFSVLELVRPTSLYSFIAALFFFIMGGFLQQHERSRVWKAVGVMIGTNVLFFWTPYITYNQIAYGRPLASPWGYLLFQGLAEYENPWGFKLDDEWAGGYMKERYNVQYGTVEFTDKSKEVFFKALYEKPSHFIFSVLRRLPAMILPTFMWVNYFFMPLKKKPLRSLWERIRDKCREIVSSWRVLCDCASHYISMPLFFFLGYVGFVLMFLHGNYFAVSLLMLVGILPAYHCLIAHIEPRYIVTFYVFFSFGVGYCITTAHDVVRNKCMKG
jgi:hypothetical protein